MRIGDILLADGVIGAGDLDAALSEQLVTRSWEQAAGGTSVSRLGSVLHRRGLVPADVVARALARQHGVPAALGRHLESRDPALAAYLPPELARRLIALPVAQTQDDAGLTLIVCMRDPQDPAARELIRRAAGMPIIAAVACEAVLAPIVARVYAIDAPRLRSPAVAPRPAPDADADAAADAAAAEGVDVDFDDTGPIVAEPVAQDEFDPLISGAFTLVDLDDRGVARDETQVAPPPQHRPSGSMAVPTSSLTPDSLRIAGERLSMSSIPAPAAPPSATPVPISLEAARARIADATDKDEITDAAIAFLAGRYAVGLVLVVRDGLALGQRGFGGALNAVAVEAMVIPLNQPSVLRTAHDHKTPFNGVATEPGIIQERFLRATGAAPGAPPVGSMTRGGATGHSVLVVPVSLRERVVSLLFAHSALPGHPAERSVDDVLALARAMEAAFFRLIREHKPR